MDSVRLDPAQFDAQFGKDRLDCTGGRRFLYALPDGSIYRCPHLDSTSIGDIMDADFRARIIRDANRRYPCLNAKCVAACGGLFSEQRFIDGSVHVGVDPTWKRLVGKNYMVFHAAITPICNYACSYCSSERWMTEYAVQKKKVLNKDEWMDVAAWMTDHFEAGTVVVYGGEPTVHPVFHEFVKHFVRHGWIVDVLTNLQLGDRLVALYEDLTVAEREGVRIIFAAHVNQPKFDIVKVQGTLEKIRQIAPRTDLVVVYVKAEANLRSMSFEMLKKSLGHIVIEFAQTEDIHAKIQRLNEHVSSTGQEDIITTSVGRPKDFLNLD